MQSIGNGYITAASTPKGSKCGYVFLHCHLQGTPDATKVFLGRPWRPYAQVVYIHSDMDKHILPLGWNNWGKAENESTAFYAEYASTGAGAKPAERVPWSHQLTAAEAAKYNLRQIFGDWQPCK